MTQETSTSIRPGDRITLHYRLATGEDEVVNTFGETPEPFTLGSGELEARLETLLLNLQVGQHVTFELEPGDGFGPYNPTLVHTLARTEFPADMDLQVGHGVQFNLPNGQSMMGTVRALEADTVNMDFNHPLAGLPVTFEVLIVGIG